MILQKYFFLLFIIRNYLGFLVVIIIYIVKVIFLTEKINYLHNYFNLYIIIF